MFFPASSLLMNVSLYGGLALFGGFQLYDTQRIVKAAQQLPATARFDAMSHSISIYQNTLNIFIRMVQIFAQQGQSKRR
jgi:FtsH-binding integral membrane protein